MASKESAPFNPSMADQGKFALHFRHAAHHLPEEQMAEAFEQVIYMNLRHTQLWSARQPRARAMQSAALDSIRTVCSDVGCARLLGRLDLAQLNKLMPPKEDERLNAVIE